MEENDSFAPDITCSPTRDLVVVKEEGDEAGNGEDDDFNDRDSQLAFS